MLGVRIGWSRPEEAPDVAWQQTIDYQDSLLTPKQHAQLGRPVRLPVLWECHPGYSVYQVLTSDLTVLTVPVYPVGSPYAVQAQARFEQHLKDYQAYKQAYPDWAEEGLVPTAVQHRLTQRLQRLDQALAEYPP